MYLFPDCIPAGKRRDSDPIWIDEDGCWLWQWNTANPTPTFDKDGKKVSARSYLYAELRGPVPEGHWLKPVKCGKRRCVNPEHMEVKRRKSKAERQAERERYWDQRDQFFWDEQARKREADKAAIAQRLGTKAKSERTKMPAGGYVFGLCMEIAEETGLGTEYVMEAGFAYIEWVKAKRDKELSRAIALEVERDIRERWKEADGLLLAS